MENSENLLPFSGCEYQDANAQEIFAEHFKLLRRRAVERRFGRESHKWCTFLFSQFAWTFGLFFLTFSRTIYRAEVRLMNEKFSNTLRLITPKKIDDKILIALVAAEDHRFWLHKGVDHVAIVRAAACCLKGRREGASTIEQQIVRVITGDYNLTIRRKFKEMALAVRLRELMGKKALLHLYLEIAYFGKDAEGIEALAKKLGFEVDGTSFEEAATVAACLKYPVATGEVAHTTRRRARRIEHILSRLAVLPPINKSSQPENECGLG